MPSDIWAPKLTNYPSLRNKTFPRGCKGCATICCDYDLWKPSTQGAERIFCTPEKKSKAKEQFYNNDFRKVVIDNSILDAQRDLHTSKYKIPPSRPYDASLWKPAERNKVCTSKLRFVASTETFNGNQAKELHYIDVVQV